MRRIGVLLLLVTLVTSIWYFFAYLTLWEWNRALIAGTLLVAAEVGLVAIMLLSRLDSLGRRVAEADRSERIKARLEKPPADLELVLDRLASHLARPRAYLRWINASLGSELRLITVDEVAYFRSDTKYTRIVTASQESLIRKSVRELVTELDPDSFWQIHRSIIVNVAEIARVQRDFRGRIELQLKHRPETLPVSQPYAARFRQM